MDFNRTLVIKAAQAEREFVRKMKLERRMIPEIKSLFSNMATDFRNDVASRGIVPNADVYAEEWRALMMRQYRRVGREFIDTAQKSKFYELLMTTKAHLTEVQSALLAAAFLEWSRRYALDQSLFITETNQKDFDEAFLSANEQAREIFTDTGVTLSQSAIAALATIELKKKFLVRVDLIANMQTQTPAEQAKRLEARAIGQANDVPVADIVKDWLTVGGPKVRDSHRAANGQRRRENEPFVVGSGLQNYPSDPSLGAAIGDIINCRCSAFYSQLE